MMDHWIPPSFLTLIAIDQVAIGNLAYVKLRDQRDLSAYRLD
jgi:hypothetical protein